MWGQETTITKATLPQAGRMPARGRFWRVPPLTLPRADEPLALRLTLLGVVIALHNVLELPRELLTGVFGARLTSLLIVVAVATSLVLLLVALAERPPIWRWLRARPLQVGVLALTLVAALLGLRAVGTALVAGFQPPFYPNDGTTLDHYAAQELLRGHNPYVTSDIVAAMRSLHQADTSRVTPLHQGVFASRGWSDYPSRAELKQVFATEPQGQPRHVVEFESHVSYPALAFLPLAPFIWAGLPSVVLFFALCFVALAALLLASVPPPARPWVALLILADVPLLNATVAGDLDVFYILLLFVAWRFMQRPMASTVALGLALAAKQLAWFFLPYYVITVWREHGWRAAAQRVAGSAGVFLAINAPFIANSPRTWAVGVLAPQLDPMFPQGTGFVRLALYGWLPLLPAWTYLALELVALVGCLVWYARTGWRRPELAFVLAVLPLFFAWRSLTTYFYFVALPAFALLLAREHARPEETQRDVKSGRKGRKEERINPLRNFANLRGLCVSAWEQVGRRFGIAPAGRR